MRTINLLRLPVHGKAVVQQSFFGLILLRQDSEHAQSSETSDVRPENSNRLLPMLQIYFWLQNLRVVLTWCVAQSVLKM